MKKKITKKIIATISAFTLLSSTAVPMYAFAAGQMLGQTDFEENIGLPWRVYCYNTAEANFDITDGKYEIEIIYPGGSAYGGEDRWDCQFSHGGLHIEKGHTYEVSYEITADHDGKYYSKIGNLNCVEEDGLKVGEVWHNNGKVTINGETQNVEYDDGWVLQPISANETKKVTAVFTAVGTIESAEWTFHLGGAGQYTPGGCFPAGTKITFDNMSLIDFADDYDKWPEEKLYDWKDISINQLGYITGLKKQATYAPSNNKDGRYRESVASNGTISFEIQQNGAKVYEGTSKEAVFDSDSENYTYVLDFSEFDVAGDNYKLIVDGCESYEFSIGTGDKIYKGLYEDAMNYFYLNRSGIDIEEKYVVANNYDNQIAAAKENNVSGKAIKKENLAREAGHTNDNGYIQSRWAYLYNINGEDVERTAQQDVSGGWYDYGNYYCKSVVNGSVSIWTLLNIYERAMANNSEKNYKNGTLLLPENTNSIPDILDEAKYELDFLLKMIINSGEYEGMVYYDIENFKWVGLAVSPAYATELSAEKVSDTIPLYRIINPPTTEATLDLAACAAQMARLIKPFDEEYADKCLAASEKAYNAALVNSDLCKNNFTYHEHRHFYNTSLNDEFYWAACELWLTTGKENYLEDMKNNENYLAFPCEINDNDVAISSFSIYTTQGFGTTSLALNYAKLSDDMKDKIVNNIITAADKYIEIEEKQGYGIPLEQTTKYCTGYPLDSNTFVMNNIIAMALAYNISGDSKYLDGATSGMDYIMGRNAMETSYVTGYGSHHTTFVSSCYWAGQLDADNFPVAPSGVLASGPNSITIDEYMRAAGYKIGEVAPQCAYLDNIEAWSTNETTINLNASLAWVTDFFTTLDDIGVIKNTEKETLYGDVNLDGTVDLSDLTTLALHLLNDIELKGQALLNADMKSDSKIDLADLAKLKILIS